MRKLKDESDTSTLLGVIVLWAIAILVTMYFPTLVPIVFALSALGSLLAAVVHWMVWRMLQSDFEETLSLMVEHRQKSSSAQIFSDESKPMNQLIWLTTSVVWGIVYVTFGIPLMFVVGWAVMKYTSRYFITKIHNEVYEK